MRKKPGTRSRKPEGRLRYGFILASCFSLLVSFQCFAQHSGKNWTPPRTPDGQPDLQGLWTNLTITPLERPAEFADKPLLTKAEAAEYETRILANNNADRRWAR